MSLKISIITPTYNQVDYIEDTIYSILNQQYSNLEYIIIDGGSNDGTQDVLKKHEKSISYSESTKDNGMYDALNKGFNRSTGDIMAWINSDDAYFPKALHIVSEIFTRFPSVNWITGASSFMDEKGRIVQSTPPGKWSKYKFYLREYKWIQQESVFWRRSLWNKAGSKIDTSLKLAGDLELWLRFSRYEKLYSVNAPLGCFRLRSRAQKTLEQIDDYNKEANMILDKEPISAYDEERVKQIRLYRKQLKIPVFRTLLDTERKHDALFDFPPELYFERKSQLFQFKG